MKISPVARSTIPVEAPSHAPISQVVGAGAAITLLSDGDVRGDIARAQRESGVDVYVGIGGAPEGVLAAAALQCIGGFMQGRLLFRNDDERGRAANCGISDFDRKYELDDMASGDVMFATTSVTDGAMLDGVRRFKDGATTHSIIMRSKSGTVRNIKTDHNFNRKSGFGPMDR